MSKLILPNNKDRSKNFLNECYASLSRRFGRVSLPEPLVYEFTDDRALLHQYYRLREMRYRKVFKMEKFVGKEDVHDKISHILIARRGKLCVGGCRLTIRDGDEDFLLPMEKEGFILRKVFPHLPLNVLRHAENARFAVLDDDQDKWEVMRTLYKLIAQKCEDLGVGVVFYQATLPMARNWRKIGHSCGLKKIRICTDIEMPAYYLCPEVKWYVSEVILPPAERIINSDKVSLTIPENYLVH